MSGWKIVLHEKRPEHPKVGDLFPAPWILQRQKNFGLSPQYFALPEPRRLPLTIILPGGTPFCIDEMARARGDYYGVGWAVSGDPATSLTLAPSVNIVGAYHGWIRDGVISEDVEGRRFPDEPRTA